MSQVNFENSLWVLQIFLVVFLTLSANFIQRRLLRRLFEKLQKTPLYWDDALVDAVRRPLTFIIWLLGLSLAADIAVRRGDSGMVAMVSTIRELGVSAILAWFCLRLVARVEQNIILTKESSGKDFDRTMVDATSKLIRASVIITTLLMILQTLGYSISGLLAVGGIGGLAVGLAAKDLLANLFGGIVIYLDRPFTIGDWIRSPDRDIEGVVEAINWRVTRIRTFDQRPLYIPNALFSTISVENPSRMTNRRIKEVIGVRYGDASKMQLIIDSVRQMLQTHKEIETKQTLIVNFDQFAPSSLNFFIYTFTKTTDWVKFHQVKQDVLLKIIDIISLHGAECAFPTSTLHIADQVSVNHASK